MKTPNLSALSAITICIVLSGCALCEKHDPIPLTVALTQIGDSIRAADRNARGKKATGLVPAEVIVALQVTTERDESGKLELSVTPIQGAGITGGWGLERKTGNSSTITVRYLNRYFDKDGNWHGGTNPPTIIE